MNLRNPRMVGFGISNEATFRAACENASGAIIGSRFVTLLHEEKNPEKAITRLKAILNLSSNDLRSIPKKDVSTTEAHTDLHRLISLVIHRLATQYGILCELLW